MAVKKFPKLVKFFIADTILADSTNSKPNLIGLFPNDLIFIRIPSDREDPTNENPIVLASLAILATLVGPQGHFDAGISLYRPDGGIMFEDRNIEDGLKVDAKPPKNDANLIVTFQPFKIPQFGEFKYVLKLDKKKEYIFRFNIHSG